MRNIDSAVRFAGNGLRFAGSILGGYRSQFGQDRWVIETMFKGKRGGFFVDIGASDGWLGSNTYVLEKRFGWTGICIEPNDALFRKLQRNRSCTLVNTCIADAEKDVEFLEAAGTWGGMVDQYPPSHEKVLRTIFRSSDAVSPDGKWRTVIKKALPLATVLDQNHAPHVIDYLSLDTECSEYLILKNFPFDRYTFLTLTIEHGAQYEAQKNVQTLLEANGYKLEKRGYCDDFYSHPLIAQHLS